MGFIKKVERLMFIILCLVCIAGCNSPSISNTSSDTTTNHFDNNSFFEVSNKEDKKSIFNYCLDYKLYVPGTEISYSVLWKGYDDFNKFGPSISLKNNFYTYLVEYEEFKNVYLWITIDKNELKEFNDWYTIYKKEHSYDSNNYHFDDDINVLDGKYLLYAQLKHIDKYKVYSTSNPFDTSFINSNEQAAVCLESKEIQILKNVSTNKVLNKKITALNRFEVKFDEKSNKFEKYYFDNFESFNINYAQYIFSNCGKRLECYSNKFEEMDYCYCPLMGLFGFGNYKTKRVNLIDDQTVVLPRYIKTNNEDECIDLLDTNENFDYIEDVYGDLKSAFLEALLYDYSVYDGHYKYSVFNYEKIAEIIERKD